MASYKQATYLFLLYEMKLYKASFDFAFVT